MRILHTESFEKVAKDKYPKSETEPYNPWAVCNKSTGGKKEDPEKFERCVHHLKDQNREKNKKSEDMKSVMGRPVRYRTNETPDDVFDERLDDEFSGKSQREHEQKMDDVWLDALNKLKHKEKTERQPSYAFVVESNRGMSKKKKKD